MIELVFQNPSFVVAFKPCGMLTVWSRMGQADPRPCLGHLLTQQLGQRIWPVHRLDFGVSGLVMFALSDEAHRVANGWFENRYVHKVYQALTDAKDDEYPLGKSLRWECLLLKGKKRAYEGPTGKTSITLADPKSWATIQGRQGTLWELSPLTGRSHQLRYEMYRHGIPIWGDRLYGSSVPWEGPESLALRAVRLDFSKCPQRERWQLPADLMGPPLYKV